MQNMLPIRQCSQANKKTLENLENSKSVYWMILSTLDCVESHKKAQFTHKKFLYEVKYWKREVQLQTRPDSCHHTLRCI